MLIMDKNEIKLFAITLLYIILIYIDIGHFFNLFQDIDK